MPCSEGVTAVPAKSQRSLLKCSAVPFDAGYDAGKGPYAVYKKGRSVCVEWPALGHAQNVPSPDFPKGKPPSFQGQAMQSRQLVETLLLAPLRHCTHPPPRNATHPKRHIYLAAAAHAGNAWLHMLVG